MKAPSQQQDSCCLHRQIAAACFLSRGNLMDYLHLPPLQRHWCQWHSGCSGDSSALTFQPHSQLINSYFSVTVFSFSTTHCLMLRRSRFVAAFLIRIRIEHSFVTAALQRGLVTGSTRKAHSSVDRKRCNSCRGCSSSLFLGYLFLTDWIHFL